MPPVGVVGALGVLGPGGAGVILRRLGERGESGRCAGRAGRAKRLRRASVLFSFAVSRRPAERSGGSFWAISSCRSRFIIGLESVDLTGSGLAVHC